jgi:hypothetical protein
MTTTSTKTVHDVAVMLEAGVKLYGSDSGLSDWYAASRMESVMREAAKLLREIESRENKQ